MHKITIFPLGNADTTRVDLEGGEKLLIDYADIRDPEDEEDKRIDLPTVLRRDLDEANRMGYDVVAFTHLDHDHIAEASDFFTRSRLMPRPEGRGASLKSKPVL